MYYTVKTQKKTSDMLFILFGFFGGLVHFLFFSKQYWVSTWEAVVLAALCAMAAWTGTALMKMIKTWYIQYQKRKR